MALQLDTIGKTIGPLHKPYDWKDVVLYALGVGAGFDDLEYAYENKLKVLPSFSIGAVFDFLAASALSSQANLAGILHGEQEIIFHAPIPREGTLSTEGRITRIYDKGEGRGALVVSEADTVHSDGTTLFTNIFTLFCRLDGGFGGENAPAEEFSFPDRDPDFVEVEQPPANQPLLYRLSGDIFALHVDPDFAAASGFEKPIMHGLCTHGYACRHVVKHLMHGAPERMTRFKCRFSKTLYPGVPIRTEIWVVDDGEGGGDGTGTGTGTGKGKGKGTGKGKALWRTLNGETGQVVIDRGVVEWNTGEVAAATTTGAGGPADPFGGLGARVGSRAGGDGGRAKDDTIRFDRGDEARVAIVTGAGAGLGRAYALELAKRGARVVVNDLGGARDGSGDGSARAADAVVDEIVAAGGQAVASYDSVATAEGGAAIVDKAVEAFGRVDIVINNAGILRDRSLLKMEPADWSAVRAVHLDGAYNVTRPAFALMKAQGFGRIVVTTSAAGLFGNFGQTNYSAAKLGIVGLASTIKLEGRKVDIKINTVAPIAATRLTEDILPPDLMDKLQPQYVAPLVVFLASDDCPVTGKIYNAGAGYFSRAAVVSGPGAMLADGDEPATVEQVIAAYDDIATLDGAEEYDDAMALLMPMIQAVQSGQRPGRGRPSGTRPASNDGGGGGGKGGGGITAADVFARMADAFKPDAAAGVNVVFQFNLTGDGRSGDPGGEWNATIADGSCKVGDGQHAKPTTTIAMEASDFIDMIAGKANAMSLYTSGKIKIGGDLMKSQLIEKIFAF